MPCHPFPVLQSPTCITSLRRIFCLQSANSSSHLALLGRLPRQSPRRQGARCQWSSWWGSSQQTLKAWVTTNQAFNAETDPNNPYFPNSIGIRQSGYPVQSGHEVTWFLMPSKIHCFVEPAVPLQSGCQPDLNSAWGFPIAMTRE